MASRKSKSENLKQQSLVGFLNPNASKTSNSPTRSRSDRLGTKSGLARRSSGRTTRDPPQLSEPSGQSDTDSDVDAIHFEPRKAVTVISDDDDIQPPSPTKRRRTIAEVESHVGHDNLLSSDSDESMSANRRAMSPIKSKRPVARSPSTEPESPPKRRRLARGVRPSSPEESDNLLDEVNEADIIQSRFRDRQKRTAFQMKLEKLRKKKLGVTRSQSSDEQTSEDNDHTASIEDSQQDSHDDECDGDEDNVNIDDFVVQDDGVAMPELPMAFSRLGHQDTRHDFKIVCQLFVHLAMMPMVERRGYMENTLKDEFYFSVPFQVIRRKTSSTRDSIASSVWRRDYRDALELYPDLTLVKLDFAVPHCDACHLGGRQSTVEGRLKGIPYDKLSLEPIIDESDSEDLEEEHPRITSFSLGRFCAARTQIFHKLSHWNYHMYRTLSEEVDLAKQPRKRRSYDRLAYAKNLPPPEDISNPDDVMEWLDQRGTISAEWQKLRELLERASQLDASVGKREEDVDLDI